MGIITKTDGNVAPFFANSIVSLGERCWPYPFELTKPLRHGTRVILVKNADAMGTPLMSPNEPPSMSRYFAVRIFNLTSVLCLYRMLLCNANNV